ncbi:class I SAM-dependent methyltransferase [Bradyrhizobium sp. SYSU BS000235]|uniref:class I SAM-dependent methyltransferase n=1 Tax=Bradyrhizobium sp. SYSU BS000235 TaxID=3411332 RepID=UPI003C7888DA
MGFYDRYVGPRIVSCLCSLEDVTEQRRLVLPKAHGVVLEVGIGSGLNLPHYDPSKVKRVIGVDPGEGFLALGKERSNNARVPLELIQAPAEKIPLDDNIADTAVLTYTLCSVSDPQQALREIRRVLKPDGTLIFCEHGKADNASVIRWQDRLNPIWNVLACGCNLNRDTVGLLAGAGFQIGEIERFYLPRTPKPVGFHCRGVASPSA